MTTVPVEPALSKAFLVFKFSHLLAIVIICRDVDDVFLEVILRGNCTSLQRGPYSVGTHSG